MSSLQSSIQRELDRFFKSYNGKELSERYVSQSAFSQARHKIKPSAFRELNNDSVNYFYSTYNYKKWQGFRLIAIDGSEVQLPKNSKTVSEYGEYTTNFMNKNIVLARISKAYDVLNKINIDAALVNRGTGEHRLAKQHLEFCKNDDLLLLDRGYPSFDLFRSILNNESHFCARLAVSNWRVATELVESGEKEIIADIKPSNDLKRKYKEQGIAACPIKCRFLCIQLPSGEKEVLITSLLDTQKYPHRLFKGLYHLRWDIEESYKKDKYSLQLENFSGTSVLAIQQDFYAKILLSNLTAIISFSLSDTVNKKKPKNKYRYQLNFTTALSKIRESMVLLFTRSNITDLLLKIIQMLIDNILPIRLDRSFVRNKQKRKRYYKSYLPL